MDQIDVIDRIKAALSIEPSAAPCRDYFVACSAGLQRNYREKMVEWILEICDSFSIKRETCWTAFAILDKYLSSPNGLREMDSQRFQLVAITSFYTAVKISEPVQLGLDMTVRLCHGYYQRDEIIRTELEILDALNWRLNDFTSPEEFVRHFLELAPVDKVVRQAIMERTDAHFSRTMKDHYFSLLRPSSVAIALLGVSIEETGMLENEEIDCIWSTLIRLSFDVNESRQAEQRLMNESKSRTSEHRIKPVATLQKTSSALARGSGDSSPVSVMC